MNMRFLTRHPSLRQFTVASSTCLILLSQMLTLMTPVRVPAQTRKRVATRVKKRKRHETVATPIVLPPFSLRSPDVAPSSLAQPTPDSKQNSRSQLFEQSVTQSEPTELKTTIIQAVSIGKVSLRTLTKRSKGRLSSDVLPTDSNQLIPAPGSIKEVNSRTPD